MLNYVSLFSSAGIGCFGLKLEGFTCIATAELIQRRIDIQKVNHKCRYSTGYICGDLTKPNTYKQLFDEITAFKEKENAKHLVLIVATPPCQGMSVANHKKNNELGRKILVLKFESQMSDGATANISAVHSAALIKTAMPNKRHT